MIEPLADRCQDALDALRASQSTRGRIEPDQRKDLLGRLERAVVRSKETIVRAIDADFGGRSREETLFGEVLGAVNALRHARRHLDRWVRPRKVPVGTSFWPARAWIVPQPRGVVGVMSPWNYPLLLSLSPMAGALAAGNRVMLKPSEHTPRTAEELACLLDLALGKEVARTILGGPEVARSFASLKLDHLTFTGSTARGREVALAAAANLVPVTLELGGKCPAIVLPDADLDAAAQAIILGKGLNAGQTCLAPDHVLLVGLAAATFVPKLEAAAKKVYPHGLNTKVIAHARERLADTSPHRARLNIVVEPDESSPLVTQEVFGPILPVHTLHDLNPTIERLKKTDAPLAIYLFSKSKAAEQRLLDEVATGALVVGGTVLQAAIDELPFGGVGASGMGRYHGQAGFDALSNLMAHVHAPRFNLARLGQPPYGKGIARLLARLLPEPARND